MRLFRCRYFEVSPAWGLALGICHFHGGCSLHVMPLFGNFFIRLPRRFHRPPEEIMDRYGFSWDWSRGLPGQEMHLGWGAWWKVVRMPWSWEHVRHDVLMADGNWKRVAKVYWLNGAANPDASPWNWTDKFQETHDYTYLRKNGEKQERKATIGVEEREWRWRWFRWMPFPRMVRRTIDVKFSDEVGERSGSWKGGTVGCGYDMRKGEAPLDTLRRMEREREFS